MTPKGKELIGRVDSLLKDLQTIVEKMVKQTFEAYLLGKGK